MVPPSPSKPPMERDVHALSQISLRHIPDLHTEFLRKIAFGNVMKTIRESFRLQKVGAGISFCKSRWNSCTERYPIDLTPLFWKGQWGILVKCKRGVKYNYGYGYSLKMVKNIHSILRFEIMILYTISYPPV